MTDDTARDEYEALVEYAETADIAYDPLVIDLRNAVSALLSTPVATQPTCVCSEPGLRGTHRQGGPCLAPQPTEPTDDGWEYEYAEDDDPDGNVYGQVRRVVGPWERFAAAHRTQEELDTSDEPVVD